MIVKIKIDSGGYKPKTCTAKERKQLHEGMIILMQLLAQDEQERLKNCSGLPSDWRERILRGG